MEDDKEKFCWYKNEAYTVHVSPAVEEGVLTSSAGGVEQGGDGSWHFFPNKTNWTKQEVKLTYTVGDESVDKFILVFKPIAEIDYKIDEEKQVLILQNHSRNAETYTLTIPELPDFNSDWPPESGDITIPLKKINPRVINPVLVAKIGDCEHSDTMEIPIREGQWEVLIDIAKVKGRTDYKYLYNSKDDFRFFLSPPGGKPTGPDKAIIKNGDFYVFRPRNLSIGKYTFKYQETATIEVEVVRTYKSITDIGFRPIEGVRPIGIDDYLNNEGYKVDEMIVDYTVNLGEEINNKANARKEFLEGKKTSEIGTKYKEAMDKTVVQIKRAHEAGETEAANYLMNTYIDMLAGVESTTEILGENVKKSHGIYKRMEEAEGKLKSLKAMGVNIDPDKKLKKLIETTADSSMRKEMKAPIVKLNKILK
jgi:hypothetical protein